MNTLGDVKAKVRAMLGDPDGDWVTDGYITPLINQVYGDQYLNIRNACGQNLEHIALVLNVPVETTSLYNFQAEGQPLEGLYTPLELWVKPAGMPPNWFRRARGPMELPHVAPPGPPLTNGCASLVWTWLGNQLLMTPVNAALDIEVHGRFNPPALQSDDDVLVVDPAMWVATSYGGAAIAGVERANPAILEGYAVSADRATDNIAAELVRQKQGNPARTGRMDRNLAGFYSWRWR